MARSSQSFYRPPERSSKREKGQFYPTTYSQKKLEDKIWNPEESSEDEDDEESFATGTEGLQKKSFQPQRRLAPANVIKRDLQQLMDLLETPYLDLNPEYQRDVVWNKTRMTGLINSLFEDYYIPPIIFNRQKITIEDGTQRWKRICVDGKQRLSSARAFMEGKIPVKDRNGDKWWYCNESGRKAHRYILSDKEKEAFRQKEFVCYEFTDLRPEEEEDLFARVQKGVQLTHAEKLRATSGSWQALARTFEGDFPTIVHLTDAKRSNGFRLILICFAQIIECQQHKGLGKPTFRGNAAGADKFIQNTSCYTDSSKSHLARVFNSFTELVNKDPQTFKDNDYKHAKKFAPVELMAVSVLISKHGRSKPHEQLLHDIRRMRATIREKFLDIRSQPPVWAQLWGFIEDCGHEDTSNATSENKFPKTPSPLPLTAQASQPTPRASSSDSVLSDPPDPPDGLEHDPPEPFSTHPQPTGRPTPASSSPRPPSFADIADSVSKALSDPVEPTPDPIDAKPQPAPIPAVPAKRRLAFDFSQPSRGPTNFSKLKRVNFSG